ncbi:MAG: hypothetical protein N2C14_02185, partial [Planctomycetales bacterium]
MEFEHSDPCRGATWRYDRVLILLEEQPARRCTQEDDEYVKWLRDFLLRERRRDPQSRKRLFADDPELFRAYQFKTDKNQERQRHVVEARVLTGQSGREIAARCGASPRTIALYEACFFDVRDRLDRKDWVVGSVIAAGYVRDANTQSDEMFLKLFGYFGGPLVVDFIHWGFKDGVPKIADEEALGAWMDANWVETVKTRSAMASKAFAINPNNISELMKTHARILELEQSDDASHGKQSRQEANIAAMLEELPWAVGGKTHPAYKDVLAEFDASDAELSDQQLLLAAAGEITPEMEAKKLMTLPSPKRNTTGEALDEPSDR